MEDKKQPQFLLGLLSGISVIAVVGLVVVTIAFFTVDRGNGGAVAGQSEINLPDQTVDVSSKSGSAKISGVSTFSELPDAEVCTEDGLPVVFLFSTTWCPHCQWSGPGFDEVVQKYVDAGKIKAYHWEIDTGDNTLTSAVEKSVPDEHMSVYETFNPKGSIPTFVFGCKYHRIGNGHEQSNDLEAEKAEFEAVIQELIK